MNLSVQKRTYIPIGVFRANIRFALVRLVGYLSLHERYTFRVPEAHAQGFRFLHASKAVCLFRQTLASLLSAW